MRYNKIFLIGFPKAGTSTFQEAFSRSGLKSAHWLVKEGFVGDLMYRGLNEHNDPWFFLNDYRAVTQGDVCASLRSCKKHFKKDSKIFKDLSERHKEYVNYWPQLDFVLIKKMQEQHPDCLFILNYRQPEKIVASIFRWEDLQMRIKKLDIIGLPVGRGPKDELHDWITDHYRNVREYFKNKDNFIEVNIEDPQVPIKIAKKLGVYIRWWGIENANKVSGSRIKKVFINTESFLINYKDYFAEQISNLKLLVQNRGRVNNTCSLEKPYMTEKEIHFLKDALKDAREYFEFGIGGSTILAATYPKLSISGIDSSRVWIREVKDEVRQRGNVKFKYVFIGLLGAFGRPLSYRNKFFWKRYSKAIHELAQKPDVILIDGRFRVACAVQAIIFSIQHNIKPKILLHDSVRGEYAILYKILLPEKNISSSQFNRDGLQLFRLKDSYELSELNEIYELYKYDIR